MDLWRYAWGPALHSVYEHVRNSHGPREEERLKHGLYVPNLWESRAERVVSLCRMGLKTTAKLSSLVLVYFVVWKGWQTRAEFVWLSYKLALTLALAAGIQFVATMVRGFGRTRNPAYGAFFREWDKAKKQGVEAQRALLQHYDYEFEHAPIKHAHPHPLRHPLKQEQETSRSLSQRVLAKVHDALVWCIAYGFARPIIFPGSVSLVNWMMNEFIVTGRTRLIALRQFTRAKIRTSTGMLIDTVYLDRRETAATHADKLVIVCQGNCSFYETSMLDQPFVNAVSAVLHYVFDHLGWAEDQVIIYGWSIGGYSAAFAASIHPNLGGLVIDASFANIVPMARARMPPAVEHFVDAVVNQYFDLNVAGLASRFHGPLLLIKRLHDEIMSSNRAHRSCTDELIETVLIHRYPQVFVGRGLAALREYLNVAGTHTYARPSTPCSEHMGDDERRRWALHIASIIVRVVDSSHNDPLPVLPDIFAMLQPVQL